MSDALQVAANEGICGVLIIFKDRADGLLACLDRLCPQLSETQHLLLVDDGSRDDIRKDSRFADYLRNSSIFLERHGANLGVGAARNTGIRWALDGGYDLLLMTDSDCLVSDTFILDHLAAHKKYPSIPVISGAVRGEGHTLWARLDRMMTWFHCFPGNPEGIVRAPYSAPTANISIKVHMLPFGRYYFDEYLRTGEDTAFSRKVRDAGFAIVFSPRPEIGHQDRSRLRDFLKHQYEFGRHHYVIAHLDFGIRRVFLNPAYRFFFAVAFVFVLPLYSAAGCAFNIHPWLRRDARNLIYWPLMQVVWLLKGAAVLETACFPRRAFRWDRRADASDHSKH